MKSVNFSFLLYILLNCSHTCLSGTSRDDREVARPLPKMTRFAGYDQKCPEEYYFVNSTNMCYYPFTIKTLTKSQASQLCKAPKEMASGYGGNGGRLVNGDGIHLTSIIDLMTNHVPSTPAMDTKTKYPSCWWIGISKTNNSLYWDKGYVKAKVEGSNFDSGQGIKKNQINICSIGSGSNKGKWLDLCKTNVAYTLCEKSPILLFQTIEKFDAEEIITNKTRNKLLGCFRGKINAFSGSKNAVPKFEQFEDNSPTKCVNHCRKMSNVLAVTNGEYCVCSNTLKTTTKLEGKVCNKNCPEEPGSSCGGDFSYTEQIVIASVYATGINPKNAKAQPEVLQEQEYAKEEETAEEEQSTEFYKNLKSRKENVVKDNWYFVLLGSLIGGGILLGIVVTVRHVLSEKNTQNDSDSEGSQSDAGSVQSEE